MKTIQKSTVKNAKVRIPSQSPHLAALLDAVLKEEFLTAQNDQTFLDFIRYPIRASINWQIFYENNLDSLIHFYLTEVEKNSLSRAFAYAPGLITGRDISTPFTYSEFVDTLTAAPRMPLWANHRRALVQNAVYFVAAYLSLSAPLEIRMQLLAEQAPHINAR